MTKSWIRRTGSGYKAVAALGNPARDGDTPDSHSERCGVDPTSPREGAKPYLRRSRLWSIPNGLPREQSRGTGAEKSAEAIVALPGEGPNLLCKEQVDDFDERGAAERRSTPRRGPGGRNPYDPAWTAASVRGIRPTTSLDSPFDGAG